MFMRSRERYFGVYFMITTKITLSWAHKLFLTRASTLFSISHSQVTEANLTWIRLAGVSYSNSSALPAKFQSYWVNDKKQTGLYEILKMSFVFFIATARAGSETFSAWLNQCVSICVCANPARLSLVLFNLETVHPGHIIFIDAFTPPVTNASMNDSWPGHTRRSSQDWATIMFILRVAQLSQNRSELETTSHLFPRQRAL